MQKVITFIILVLLYLSSCGSPTNVESIEESRQQINKDQELVSAEDVSSISIPRREHGYSNLSSTIISNNSDLDQFINNITDQEGWNDKPEFITVLQNEVLNFDNDYLLFYFHTEGSGSIEITVKDPVWADSDSNKVLITIEREIPEIGTGDMAYYGFVFKVKNYIKEIIIEPEEKTSVIFKNE